MSNIKQLITDHIDIWTAADTPKKSGRGRASSNAGSVYGIRKLRELILELAVRGKLVPQDANDEPASELLKRIQAEKAKLVAAGKIKKDKVSTLIAEDEKSFNLPKNWLWTRLGNVIDYVNGFAFSSKDFSNDGIGVVKIGDIQFGRLTPESMSRVSSDIIKDLDARLKVEPGDLLIAMSGATTGKLGFNDTNDIFYLNQRVGKIVPFVISKKFLYFDLTTKIAANLEKSFGSAIPNLSTEQINAIVIALPSLEEQHRIVAKVEELMALCDQLEAQHSNAADAHEQLVSHLLGTLTQSQDAADFNTNWQRIATHFDTLFTTESCIDTLKQTLLQLAVMGKLVPQDQKDESARELLKRIQAEKAKLIAEGKIRKVKPFALIANNEKPFSLPQRWEWARIGELVESTEYGISDQTFDVSTGVPVLKMGDIQDGKVILGDQKKVDAGIEGLPDLYLKPGDLLYNRTNSAELVGKTGIFEGVENSYTFASYLIRIRCIDGLFSPRYLNFVMNSPLFRKTQIDPHLKQQCGQANVNGTIMKNMIISFPSLKEQHLIVTKVDELTSLCGQLKSRITDANQIQQKFANVVVEKTLS